MRCLLAFLIVVVWGTRVDVFAQATGMTPEQESEVRRILESIPVTPDGSFSNVSPPALESSPESGEVLRRFLRDEERRLEIGRLEAEMRRVMAKRAAKRLRGRVAGPVPPATITDHSPETTDGESASERLRDPRGPVPSAEAVTKTREERLEELRIKKGTMTAEEYQRKRIEILMEGVGDR